MTKTLSPAEHHARMVKMAGHSDEREDRALVKKMVKPAALTGKRHGGEAAKRAMGGAMPKHKGKVAPKSQTNILISPRGAGAPPAASPAAMAGPGPMPSRPAVPVPGGPAGGPGLGAMPGAMGAKKGGKVEHKKRANGGDVMGKDASDYTKTKSMKGYDAGAGSGEGRLEKEAHYGVKPPKGVNYNSGAQERKAAGSYNTGARK